MLYSDLNRVFDYIQKYLKPLFEQQGIFLHSFSQDLASRNWTVYYSLVAGGTLLDKSLVIPLLLEKAQKNDPAEVIHFIIGSIKYGDSKLGRRFYDVTKTRTN